MPASYQPWSGSAFADRAKVVGAKLPECLASRAIVALIGCESFGWLMRVAVLSSAGKDSTYSCWWALMQGWSVDALVTVHVTSDDSMMFQLPNTSLAGLQAASMGVPWLPVLSEGVEEEEIGELEVAIRGGSDVVAAYERVREDSQAVEFPPDIELVEGPLEIDALVVGALRSDYQKTRIERMCERLGLISYCPLWHHSPEEHMDSLVQHGFDVRIVSVSTEGLGEDWLGARLDEQSLALLAAAARKYRFNLDGEGGEFETIVVAAPQMSQSIEIAGNPEWHGRRGTWRLNEARLVGTGPQ